MKVKYIGKITYPFHIYRIGGIWKKDEEKEITEEEYELIKNNPDFVLIEHKKKKEEIKEGNYVNNKY